LRISISGGGTDLYGYARFYGGNVVNLAVDTYARVMVERNPKLGEVKVIYDRVERAPEAKRLRHRPSAEVLQMAGIESDVTVRYLDSVSTDSGIGLRGAVHVSALHAAYAYAGRSIGTEKLAQGAVDVSRVVDLAGGIQDEYAAAFGGINHWESVKDGRVIRHQINLTGTALKAFMECTTVFHTGTLGDYSVLTAEMARLEKHIDDFHKLSSLARQTPELLLKGDMEGVGRILAEDWEIKQSLDPNVATARMRHIDELLRKRGAWAMKVMGPGSGGTIIAMAPEEMREKIIALMSSEGLVHYDFKIDNEGSRVWSL
jgi:D-glycero-alpha-D-manno-heptose-7-phosphate kinase